MKYKLNENASGSLYITELDEMKLNYNCSESEKTGTGPGSCSRGKQKSNKENKSPKPKIDQVVHIDGIPNTAVVGYSKKGTKETFDLNGYITKDFISENTGTGNNKVHDPKKLINRMLGSDKLHIGPMVVSFDTNPDKMVQTRYDSRPKYRIRIKMPDGTSRLFGVDAKTEDELRETVKGMIKRQVYNPEYHY